MTRGFDDELTEDDDQSEVSLPDDASSGDEPDEKYIVRSRKRRLTTDDQDVSNSESEELEADRDEIKRESEPPVDDDDDANASAQFSDDSESDEIQGGMVASERVDKAKAMISSREKFWADSEGSSSKSEMIYDKVIHLVAMLKHRETPRVAMDRFLGRSTVQAKPSFKSTIKAARRKVEQQENGQSPPEKDTISFNKLTELTDYMSGPGGLPGILDLTRESLVQRLNRIPFDYRSQSAMGNNESHGPVNFETLVRIATSEAIEFRRSRTSEEWSSMPRGIL